MVEFGCSIDEVGCDEDGEKKSGRWQDEQVRPTLYNYPTMREQLTTNLARKRLMLREAELGAA